MPVIFLKDRLRSTNFSLTFFVGSDQWTIFITSYLDHHLQSEIHRSSHVNCKFLRVNSLRLSVLYWLLIDYSPAKQNSLFMLIKTTPPKILSEFSPPLQKSGIAVKGLPKCAFD